MILVFISYLDYKRDIKTYADLKLQVTDKLCSYSETIYRPIVERNKNGISGSPAYPRSESA